VPLWKKRDTFDPIDGAVEAMSRRQTPSHGPWGRGPASIGCMCRNIRTLHNFEPPAGEDEVRAAALQYVRKISGYTKPSKANEAAFARAVEAVAAASSRLLDELTTNAPPRDREVEAARARARAAERYGTAPARA
jgi:hypothetical protein